MIGGLWLWRLLTPWPVRNESNGLMTVSYSLEITMIGASTVRQSCARGGMHCSNNLLMGPKNRKGRREKAYPKELDCQERCGKWLSSNSEPHEASSRRTAFSPAGRGISRGTQCGGGDPSLRLRTATLRMTPPPSRDAIGIVRGQRVE